MKRILMLAVLCAFVLSAAVASASDFKVSGAYVNDAMWQSNWGFKDKGAKDNDTRTFDIKQRVDLVFEMIASENLKAVMAARTDLFWGKDAGALGAQSSDAIKLRRAYVDFNWPETSVNVKAGFQAFGLPAAVGGGSFILDEEVAALVVSGDITDTIGYLGVYGRPSTGDSDAPQSQLDVYAVAVPMSFDGVAVSPFFMYGNRGKGLEPTKDSFWIGSDFNMNMFDPIVVKADFNYGKTDAETKADEASGWLFDMAVEYTGLDYMTPEFIFAYTTGEDDDAANGSERMPMLAASNWAIGSFFFGGDTFLQGSIGDREEYLGFWALALTLKDIASFAEGMTHTATVIYAQGTNDKASTLGTYGRYLTEKDSLIEVDFNTYYKLYDELTLGLELGYINLDASESVWSADEKGGDAWKISTGLAYKF